MPASNPYKSLGIASRDPKYKSLFEASIAEQFKLAKVRVKYEPYKMEFYQRVPSASCKGCGSKEVTRKHTYKPDWVSEDDYLIVESKGKFTSADRTKMIAIKAQYPDKDIRILFMRDNWLTRKKLEKYSDWAERNGFTYAIGPVPKAWLKDFKDRQLGIGKAGAKRKIRRGKSK